MKLAILGATGQLGRVVTRTALDDGHQVQVFVRSPEKLGPLASEVEVHQGDLADGSGLDGAIAGADAVISCLGPSRLGRATVEVFRSGTERIIQAMQQHEVRRIVVISGAAATRPSDERSFGNRLMIGLFRLLMGSIVRSNEAVMDVLEASDREWVVVRAGNMTNAPSVGPLKASATTPPGMKNTREDLARFMLDQLASDVWVGKAPMVSN